MTSEWSSSAGSDLDGVAERLFDLAERSPQELEAELTRFERVSPELAEELRRALGGAPEPEDPIAALISGVAGRVSSHAVLLPQHIAGMTLRDRLGEGGSGEVFLAEQESTGRRLAVKVMRPGVGEQMGGFEASAIGALDHPGIARVYAAGVAEVRTVSGSSRIGYIAVEYLPGRALDTARGPGHASLRQRVAVLKKIADALAYLHDQGVVHGDLKPQNILFDGAGCPKIVDFGVSVVERFGIRARVGPGASSLAATERYAAPESRQNDPTLDARSDLYSFGLLAIEYLTGGTSRSNPGSEEVGSALRRGGLDAAQTASLASLLAACADIAPEHRPQSAGQVAAVLDRILARTLAPDDLATLSPMRRFVVLTASKLKASVRVPKGIAAATITGLVLSLGCVVALSWSSAMARRDADRVRMRAETQSVAVTEMSRELAGAEERLLGLKAMARDLLPLVSSGDGLTGPRVIAALGLTDGASGTDAEIVGELLIQHGQFASASRLLESAEPAGASQRRTLVRLRCAALVASGRASDAFNLSMTELWPSIDGAEPADARESLLVLAHCAAEAGLPDRAREAIALLLETSDESESSPGYARARDAVLGLVARQQGLLVDAEQLFRTAIASAPSSVAAYRYAPHPVVGLSEVLSESGRTAEGVSLLDEVIDRGLGQLPLSHPVRWNAEHTLARMLLATGEVERAGRLLSEMLAIPGLDREFPEGADAVLVAQRDLYRAMGNVSEELTAIRRLVELRGRTGASPSRLAIAMVEFSERAQQLLGQPQATGFAERALRLASESEGPESWLAGRAHAVMASAAVAAGDRDSGARHGRVAVELARIHRRSLMLDERVLSLLED